jgi:L-alanine-DL-glutamate epimerase-like enolase superfamily enzyme
MKMFAIVYKSDGFPISVQVAGVTPDPVVTWSDEGAAKGFIQSKGGEAEFVAVAVDDASMDAMAKAIGCPVEQLMFEPYPA